MEGSGPYANRERHPFPAMLITDLNMMHGDGFAVLELLRLNPGWSVVPKIVFTSSDDPGDIATAYLLGASTYHQKPCAASELAACVERMLSDGHLSRASNRPHRKAAAHRASRKARGTLSAACVGRKNADTSAQLRRKRATPESAPFPHVSRRQRQPSASRDAVARSEPGGEYLASRYSDGLSGKAGP